MPRFLPVRGVFRLAPALFAGTLPLAAPAPALAALCPTSIFVAEVTPTPFFDGTGVELGVKFATRGAVKVVGLRFYKSPHDPDTTHVGHLWVPGGSGQLLKTVTFTNETASGWQEAFFDTPVFPTAGSPLIASYFAASGHYVATNFGLATGAGDPQGPVFALADGALGGNGVYKYGGGFPTESFRASNYYVDVIVADDDPPQAPTGLSSPSQTGNRVDLEWNPSIDGSGELSTSVARHLIFRNAAQIATVSGTTGTFADETVMPGTTYTYVVQGQDFCDNRSPSSNALTLTTPGTAPFQRNIFGNQVPNDPVDPDTAPVELGVKFQSSIAGVIKGIRFYRGVAIPGGYRASLWTSDGTLLASINLIEGQGPTPGWQEATFGVLVPIAANTTYVASYFARTGGYASDEGGLTQAVTNGNLSALASGPSGGNGVYRYGNQSGFPTETFFDTNYWVDVIFDVP